MNRTTWTYLNQGAFCGELAQKAIDGPTLDCDNSYENVLEVIKVLIKKGVTCQRSNLALTNDPLTPSDLDHIKSNVFQTQEEKL